MKLLKAIYELVGNDFDYENAFNKNTNYRYLYFKRVFTRFTKNELKFSISTSRTDIKLLFTIPLATLEVLIYDFASLLDESYEKRKNFKPYTPFIATILEIEEKYGGCDCWYRSDDEFLNDKDVLKIRKDYCLKMTPTQEVRVLYEKGVSIKEIAEKFSAFGCETWVRRVIKNIR